MYDMVRVGAVRLNQLPLVSELCHPHGGPDVAYAPALWMTASIRPIAFTWSAMRRVSTVLARSPTTTSFVMPAARMRPVF
jgi:hypothetical protein